MKKHENSIIQIIKNDVDFSLTKKMDWNVKEIDLNKKELKLLSSIQNSERKKEFLGVRYLKNNYDSQISIEYLSNGKPIVNNTSKHISISHSKNYVSFAAAKHKIGIDIEEFNERILKVRSRFLSENEQKLFNQNSIQDLTILWSAKEALFKLNDDSGLDFKTDLIITSWDNCSTIQAEMKQFGSWIKVKLYFEIIDNLVLCFNFE